MVGIFFFSFLFFFSFSYSFLGELFGLGLGLCDDDIEAD